MCVTLAADGLNYPVNEIQEVLDLLEKVQKAEQMRKFGEESDFSTHKSSPTQESQEVLLPLSHRQFARIQ